MEVSRALNAVAIAAVIVQSAASSFEVASLKDRDPKTPLRLVGIQRSPGRMVSHCATLKALMFFAYDLTLSSRIEGLPDWAGTPCDSDFAIDTYEFQATMPVETTDAQARQMMQTFLAERFKLAIHRDTRNLPVYALTVAPGGFKLKPSEPDDAARIIACPEDDSRCHRVGPLTSNSIGDLASLLGASLGRPVIDKSGLTERYHLDLRWAGDNSPNSSLPSLPTALRESFGLVLKSETGPVQVLVVDHAERPSPN